MTVRLEKITISNFRSCKFTELLVRPYTALVGYNNAGKSNIILAIKWLLDGSTLSTDDLYEPEKPVHVEAEISGIDEVALSLLSEENQEKIKKFIINGNLKFRRKQEFDNGKTKKSLEVYDGNSWKKNPGGIDGSISNLFPEPIHIPAMSDAVEDSTKYKTSTTIGKILSAIVYEIKKEHEDRFSRNISEIDKYLSHDGSSRLAGLNKIDGGINEKVNKFFPDVSVKLHFPTPSLEDIFKSGTLKVFEGSIQGDVMRDINRFGHGTQRSIQMALIQYLAEIKQESPEVRKSNTLIFIDEPELYLHPSAINSVRESLITLSTLGYQVVISTHSASMLSAKHAANAVQVFKNENGTLARKTITEKIDELFSASSSQLHAAFNLSNSSYILFSEEVLLVEGKTETNVLPAIYKKIKNKEIDNSKACIIAVDGKGSLFGMAEVINAIGIKTRILADCDFLSLYLNSPKGAEFVEHGNKLIGAIKVLVENGELDIRKPITDIKSLKSLSSNEFMLLCENSETKKTIDLLHEKMKLNGIYIWNLGDIERVYGFNKKQSQWDELVECLDDETKDIKKIITNYKEMEDFINWI
ncbi:ATP-dependent nuclease [Serratia marcescens]|uniref:ATP-dependent nuclease n=1 Tax=Serratia nevei TaxID=2703794 RepID=UPI001C3A5684|nr:AAA family ATPase [Serratia marcescens]HEI9763371.1 AAA family ATPase [Serratia marcescens]